MSETEQVGMDVIHAMVESGGGALSVERRHPKEAALALEMLAFGATAQEVKDRTGLGFSAIAGLRSRQEQLIERRRLELAKDGFELAEMSRLLVKKKLVTLDEDEDQLRETPARDLALMYGVFQDKALQAVDGNTVTVKHEKAGLSLADAMAVISAAKAQVRGEAIAVEEVK